MENASKALIIAGAILLAILLISLGIYIFTGAQDVTKNSGLDAQEVSVFNSAMLKYEGINKSASDVRAIKNEAIAANKKLRQEGKIDASNNGAIKMQGHGGSINSAIDLAEKFDTSKLDESKRKYKIELYYNNNTGLVSSIHVFYVE